MKESCAGVYRYGFNGKEMDNEIKTNGNSYDFGARMYDPRLGRWLSVDPLTKNYPWYTPYQFAGNQPIWAIDLDGLEEFVVIKVFGRNSDGKLELLSSRKLTYAQLRNLPHGTLGKNKKGEERRGTSFYSYEKLEDGSLKKIGVTYYRGETIQEMGERQFSKTPPTERTDIPGVDQGEGETERVFENFGLQEGGSNTRDGDVDPVNGTVGTEEKVDTIKDAQENPRKIRKTTTTSGRDNTGKWVHKTNIIDTDINTGDTLDQKTYDTDDTYED